jgi:hypothetical protein
MHFHQLGCFLILPVSHCFVEDVQQKEGILSNIIEGEI